MKYINTALITLFFISCNSSPKNNRVGISIDFPNKINNELITESLILTDMVFLETSDNLISKIRRVIKYKDKIIILNKTDEVLFFSQDGKFLYKINSKGNGPDEYSNIVDITVNTNNDYLILYSDDYKLLFYDLSANSLFSKRITSEKLFECIMYESEDNIFFYNSSEPDDILIYNYSLKKDSFENKKNIDNHVIRFFIRPNGLPLVKSKSIWHTKALDNHLFNTNKECKYSIEIKEMKDSKSLLDIAPHDFNNILNKISEQNICYSLSSVRETNKSLFFKSNIHGLIRLHKQNNVIDWSDNALYDSNTGLKHLTYFPHDGDDNKIMFISDLQSFESINEKALIIKENKDEIERLRMEKDANSILLFYEERPTE